MLSSRLHRTIRICSTALAANSTVYIFSFLLLSLYFIHHTMNPSSQEPIIRWGQIDYYESCIDQKWTSHFYSGWLDKDLVSGNVDNGWHLFNHQCSRFFCSIINLNDGSSLMNGLDLQKTSLFWMDMLILSTIMD